MKRFVMIVVPFGCLRKALAGCHLPPLAIDGDSIGSLPQSFLVFVTFLCPIVLLSFMTIISRASYFWRSTTNQTSRIIEHFNANIATI